MASSTATAVVTQIVKPVTSASHKEARRAVLVVYKDLMKITPVFWWDYMLQDIPLPVFRTLLKNQFLKNKNVQDVRIIDRMVRETREHMKSIRYAFYTPYMVRNFLFGTTDFNSARPSDNRPKDFLSKFLSGKE